MTQITLTEDNIAWADDVALKRHEDRIRAGSKHKNNRPRDDAEDLRKHTFAARCELAAHLWLGTSFWDNGPLSYAGQKRADLDHFVDVKAREQSRHQLIVQFDDPPEYAYLSVCCEDHPDYSIDGWCWGYECKLNKYRKTLVPGRPAFVVSMADQSILKSAHDLRQIIQQRRQSDEHIGHQ